jgi:hypothetical protein
VQVYWRNHAAPHVHAFYQSDEALFAIEDGRLITGRMPRSGLRLMRDWIEKNRDGELGSGAVSVCSSSKSREPMTVVLVKVSRVEALDGARIRVRFSNGAEGVRDCTDILDEGGPMVEPLRDPEMFKRVFVQCGVPAWPNGFDIDAIQLHGEMKERGALASADAARSQLHPHTKA